MGSARANGTLTKDGRKMEVLSWDERWRFKGRSPGETHRQRALQEYMAQMDAIACADICTDVLSVRGSTARSRELQEDFSFPNIRARLLQPTRWKNLFACPLNIPEPVHICEARGVLASIKH